MFMSCPADGVMVPEYSENKHDYSFARDRQLQSKLLAADDNFEPRKHTASTGLRPSNPKEKFCEVTGWCPDEKVSLRKPEIEHVLTKSRTNIGYRETNGKDGRTHHRREQDLSYVFRHYPSAESYRYIEQYRREHTCSDSSNSAGTRNEFLELQRFYAYRAQTHFSAPATVGVPQPQNPARKEQTTVSQKTGDNSQYRTQKYKLSPCLNFRSDAEFAREKTVDDERFSPLGASGSTSRIAVHAVSKTPIAKVPSKVTVPANHSMISPSLNKTLRATRKISSPKGNHLWETNIGAVRTLDNLACVATTADKENLYTLVVQTSSEQMKDKICAVQEMAAVTNARDQHCDSGAPCGDAAIHPCGQCQCIAGLDAGHCGGEGDTAGELHQPAFPIAHPDSQDDAAMQHQMSNELDQFHHLRKTGLQEESVGCASCALLLQRLCCSGRQEGVCTVRESGCSHGCLRSSSSSGSCDKRRTLNGSEVGLLDQSLAERSVAERCVADRSLAEWSVAERCVAEKPSLAEWSVVDQPPVDQSPVERSPAGQSPAGQSPAGQSPASQSPAGQSPAGQPPAGQSPAGQSPAGHSPAGHSPTDMSQVQGKCQESCHKTCVVEETIQPDDSLSSTCTQAARGGKDQCCDSEIPPAHCQTEFGFDGDAQGSSDNHNQLPSYHVSVEPDENNFPRQISTKVHYNIGHDGMPETAPNVESQGGKSLPSQHWHCDASRSLPNDTYGVSSGSPCLQDAVSEAVLQSGYSKPGLTKDWSRGFGQPTISCVSLHQMTEGRGESLRPCCIRRTPRHKPALCHNGKEHADSRIPSPCQPQPRYLSSAFPIRVSLSLPLPTPQCRPLSQGSSKTSNRVEEDLSFHTHNPPFKRDDFSIPKKMAKASNIISQKMALASTDISVPKKTAAARESIPKKIAAALHNQLAALSARERAFEHGEGRSGLARVECPAQSKKDVRATGPRSADVRGRGSELRALYCNNRSKTLIVKGSGRLRVDRADPRSMVVDGHAMLKTQSCKSTAQDSRTSLADAKSLPLYEKKNGNK